MNAADRIMELLCTLPPWPLAFSLMACILALANILPGVLRQLAQPFKRGIDTPSEKASEHRSQL